MIILGTFLSLRTFHACPLHSSLANISRFPIHSFTDSQLSGNSIGGQQQQRCGEACSKKGSSSSSSATEMTQPPTKLCKTCRGHEAAKGGSTAGAESQAVAPPSKAKRNPWALRFNCVRLKGSKSSSSSSSTMMPSPAVKVGCPTSCFAPHGVDDAWRMTLSVGHQPVLAAPPQWVCGFSITRI